MSWEVPKEIKDKSEMGEVIKKSIRAGIIAIKERVKIFMHIFMGCLLWRGKKIPLHIKASGSFRSWSIKSSSRWGSEGDHLYLSIDASGNHPKNSSKL